MGTNKKGISLIVLVITIIVMIILAGAVILSLDNAGIIDKTEEAVEKTNLKQVQYLATLKWSDAFLDGKTTQQELEDAVIEGLEEEGINLSAYQITVTEKGVNVAIVAKVPSEWQENVVAIVDGVPIPKGFVASHYDGEDTKAGGLVIYELKENESKIPATETYQTSLTTRNQYVWVPIAKDEFTTKFVRQGFGYTVSNELGSSNYWEAVVDNTTKLPLPTQNSAFMTDATLAEIQKMYASVVKYEGFYIARYEAGIDTLRTSNTTLVKGSNVYSAMGKIPYTHIQCGTSMTDESNGAIEVARSLYPESNENYGVVSTLAYGVQWDSTLQWFLDTGAVQSVTDDVSANGIKYTVNDFNDGAKVYYYGIGDDYLPLENAAVSDGEVIFTYTSTGALNAKRLNNIYDMRDNVTEWTMEKMGTQTTLEDGPSETNVYVTRGGSSLTAGITLCKRECTLFLSWQATEDRGFRVAMYIK